ncbi:AAA family ATPase [Phycisphaera mikurensis]|uniref:ATPase AAA-type core domain-containing protein n=1 Tax=Phycisphaera mikurensis (strain NBRC 102666 / KCTC 22515 / FYK2301M01) TaxID=1142394 RepID=I0IF09_PHYMF|nr:ATP-binding protein [Phycisphaera mikurensis]MBB6441640.1 putative ATPase [Phycisphaera mikurensis]BAM03847.1 hypothetical protein PSMK_16880 [Phycisphaera mikurensis NBRC 102666]
MPEHNEAEIDGRAGDSPILLKAIYVRFYKSFNFDYLKKSQTSARPRAWEMFRDEWFPHVRISLEKEITTIVGANESGKSQLLRAIEIALSGDGIKHEDFCRYSPFFSAKTGMMAKPEFGVEMHNANELEAQYFGKKQEASSTRSGRIYFFTGQGAGLDLYRAGEDGFEEVKLDAKKAASFRKLLPRTIRLREQAELPDTLSVRFLVDGEAEQVPSRLTRESRRLIEAEGEGAKLALAAYDASKKTSPAAAIPAAVKNLVDAIQYEERSKEADMRLARDLLLKAAGIDAKAFGEVMRSVEGNKEGYADGVMSTINRELDECLDFPNVWAQDKDFRIELSLRETDLAFVIRDRTGTTYSFDERSSGLKHFLAYYAQYLTHVNPDGRPEVLLMDEPDAYLSASAQQDLLKILDDFSNGGLGRPKMQVLMVTHSPYLIDKNKAHAIRVVDKGAMAEGTRVVSNASRNHYEPLRSSIGAFTAETAFIGNCNLFVEGISDQVYIAGVNRVLASMMKDSLRQLNLNSMTIVPAGSASHIEYLLHLARGRDIEKPAALVLLDSDPEGKQVARALKRGGKGRAKIAEEFVMTIADVLNSQDHDEMESSSKTTASFTDIESLIDPLIAFCAAWSYFANFIDVARDNLLSSVPAAEDGDSRTLSFQEVYRAVARSGGEPERDLDKLGMAKEVVAVLECAEQPNGLDLDSDAFRSARSATLERFSKLITAIEWKRRVAVRLLNEERLDRRIKRECNSVAGRLKDPVSAGLLIQTLEAIEALLDDTAEADRYRAAILETRSTFKLNERSSDDALELTDVRASLTTLADAVHTSNDGME